MYIKKNLIKEINDSYYRTYQETKLSAVSTETTPEEVNALMLLAETVRTTDEYIFMLADLHELLTAETPLLISAYGKYYRDELNTNSHLAASILFYGNRRHTDAYIETVQLLKTSKNSCLVGGCVRDAILSITPKDYDFVTDIDYDALEKLFKDAGYHVKEGGKQFLVLMATKDGEQFEIANFRTDGMYSDGRRPESVEIGTIYDDGRRRDLTVNALYYNLTTDRIIDPNGTGIDDITNHVLRFVGRPSERLKEDKLRVWRFYRFLKRLDGFTPDPKSLKAVRTQIQKDNIEMKKLVSFYEDFADKIDASKDIKEISPSIETVFSDMERIRLEVEKMAGL